MDHTHDPTHSTIDPSLGHVRTEVEPGYGIDSDPRDRPGVPREAEPPGGTLGARTATEPSREPSREPRQQNVETEHLTREGLDELTPVVGTAQPPRGASGAMRRAAYRIPEHDGRRWMLLMAADRVDVLEHRIGPRLAVPLRSAGMQAPAEWVERNPLAAIAGAVVGAVVVRKILS